MTSREKTEQMPFHPKPAEVKCGLPNDFSGFYFLFRQTRYAERDVISSDISLNSHEKNVFRVSCHYPFTWF